MPSDTDRGGFGFEGGQGLGAWRGTVGWGAGAGRMRRACWGIEGCGRKPKRTGRRCGKLGRGVEGWVGVIIIIIIMLRYTK